VLVARNSTQIGVFVWSGYISWYAISRIFVVVVVVVVVEVLLGAAILLFSSLSPYLFDVLLAARAVYFKRATSVTMGNETRAKDI
jgi:hypothetical protein